MTTEPIKLQIIFPQWMDQGDKDVLWNAFLDHHDGYQFQSEPEMRQMFTKYVTENRDFIYDLIRIARLGRN